MFLLTAVQINEILPHMFVMAKDTDFFSLV